MYVSMDATTTRASTVIRSIPTSDTRTQASMTMPLSSTRSRTSMRLVPPAARSTAMLCSYYPDSARTSTPPPLPNRRCRQRRDLAFEPIDLCPQLLVFLQGRPLRASRQIPIIPPPVEPDLLCLVERTDQQADAN